MTYKRKTRDLFDILQYTGPAYGWEVVNTEETREDGRRSRREYRENQPEYPVKMVKRRERIAQ